MTTPAAPLLAKLERALEDAEISVPFPSAALEELSRREQDPGLAAPNLADLSAVPFVTIDGETSKDLDQALYVEEKRGGFRVHYAIADTSHFVPKGGALFAAALSRGASFYLPHASVPMLPRRLSEGVVSLTEGVPRRAVVFVSELDADGNVQDTIVRRAHVRSRKKLSFPGVQRFYDGDAALRGSPFERSLRALEAVGQALVARAEAREVVRYRRHEVRTEISRDGTRLEAVAAARLDVELYNEQLSLLCNREGARILYERKGAPSVQPIYRVHPAPLEARLSAFAAQTQAIARAHGRDPAIFAWEGPAGPRTLAAFVAGLPRDDDRVTRAIMRQAILVNARSSFSVEPSAHFGVGADIYARFSAPMREIVGVFSHHELVELLAGLGQEKEAIFADEKLRVDVVDAANRSKQTQRKLNDLVSRLVLDAIFADDASAPAGARPVRKGTVVGLTGAKVHVELDDPPVDVKLYLYDLGKALGGAWLAASPDGATLLRDKGKAQVLRVGDEIAVTVDRHDPKTDRWVLVPVGMR